MNIKNGVILYTLENDGCLNGLYTNIGAKGKIFNEVAKKVGGIDILDGQYECFYFDDGIGVPCELVITKNNDGYYKLIWMVGNTAIFEGVGYLMNLTEMVVNYWDV